MHLTPAHPLPLSLSDSIAEAYRAWGVDARLIADESPTDEARLAEMLAQAEERLREGIWRVYASSFDPESPLLRAFPRPPLPAWPSLESLLRATRSRSVMVRLPHFLQLESPVHAACRNSGAPLFVSEPENIPVAAAALISAQIDAVVTNPSDAEAFARYLKEKGVALPRLFVLVHPARSPLMMPANLLGTACAHEVHALPGVPLLTQCPLLVPRNESLFHTNPDYLVERAGDAVFISSLGADPFPLRRYALPMTLQDAGTCGCGRTAVRL